VQFFGPRHLGAGGCVGVEGRPAGPPLRVDTNHGDVLGSGGAFAVRVTKARTLVVCRDGEVDFLTDEENFAVPPGNCSQALNNFSVGPPRPFAFRYAEAWTTEGAAGPVWPEDAPAGRFLLVLDLTADFGEPGRLYAHRVAECIASALPEDAPVGLFAYDGQLKAPAGRDLLKLPAGARETLLAGLWTLEPAEEPHEGMPAELFAPHDDGTTVFVVTGRDAEPGPHVIRIGAPNDASGEVTPEDYVRRLLARIEAAATE